MTVGDIILLSIAIVFLGGCIVSWLIHIIALVYAKVKLHRAAPAVCPEDLQGISVIKPLVGVDSNLYYNLETFFKMTYPKFELLFSVQDEQDPAIMIVQKLIERYPKVDAKLFIGIQYAGPNGKVNNMMKAYQASRYHLVNISDSSIQAPPDNLYDMVGHMTADTGVVLQMPFCCDRKGFAGIYEKVFFGTMQARNMLSAVATGINCSTGMSSLIRKEIVETAGGLDTFAKYLAEDFFLAHEAVLQGYKVKLSNKLAMQNSVLTSSTGGWCAGASSGWPPSQHSSSWNLCRSACCKYVFGLSAMAFFLLHMLLWFLSDYTLLTSCQNGPLPFTKFDFLCAWLLRECTTFYLTLKSHMTSVIVWRHRKYRLKWGGTIEEI
ncbi:CEGTB-like protein [Mya arenaria]|uniref:ceramide glucosyltransferase n=1 Tax=Mya arenaria TaxID=6604 RepID=A0ABY7DZ40_MYAAR|nr:CEGTB-like protein [Mya arenaria]